MTCPAFLISVPCTLRVSLLLKSCIIFNFVKEENMDRFKKVYRQGSIEVIEIWVYTETGVNYLFHRNGNASGLTPLLNKEGKPVVSS